MGKKVDEPKRLINDIIIKIKCNLAQEGLNHLYKELLKKINNFNDIRDMNN